MAGLLRSVTVGAFGLIAASALPLSSFAQAPAPAPVAPAEACALPEPARLNEALGNAGLHPVDERAVSRDIDTLRDAAVVLDQFGETAACTGVVAAINEIAANPRAIEERTRAFFAAAEPIGAGPASAETLIGLEVTGLSGRVVGKIDDLLLTVEGSENYVVLAAGGLLGLGAERVAVPFALVRVGADGTYYAGLATADFEAAPKLESADSLADTAWLDRNRAYYAPLVAALGPG